MPENSFRYNTEKVFTIPGYERASKLAQCDKYEEAMLLLKPYADACFLTFKSYELLAYLTKKLGKYQDALKYCDIVLSILDEDKSSDDSMIVDALFKRGEVKINLKDWEGAKKDYTRILESGLDSTMIKQDTFCNRAIVKGKLGDVSGSFEDFEKGFAEGEPFNCGLFYFRGVMKKEMGDLEGALKDFDSVIQAGNYYILQAHRKSVEIYKSLGDNENYLSHLNDIIFRKCDSFPSDFYERGCLYIAMNKLVAADRDFKKIVSLDADYMDILKSEDNHSVLKIAIKALDSQKNSKLLFWFFENTTDNEIRSIVKEKFDR